MLKFLANLKIRTKFLIVPVLVAISLGVLSFLFFSQLNSQYQEILQYAKQDLLHSQDIMLFFSETDFNHNRITRFYSQITNKEEIKDLDYKKRTLKKNTERLITKIYDMASQYRYSDEDLELMQKCQLALEDYNSAAVQLIENIDKDESGRLSFMVEVSRKFATFHQYAEEFQQKLSINTQKVVIGFQKNSGKTMLYFGFSLFWLVSAAILISLIFARYTTLPITNLVETIKKIIETGNYNVRAPKECEGEIGVLIDGFNQMLFDIERAETSFVKTKTHMNQIFNSLTHMLIVTNAKGLIKTVNPILLQTLGYPKNEIIDQVVGFVLHDRMDDGYRAIDWQELAKQSQIEPQRLYYLKKDLTEVPVLFTSSVMKDKDNDFLGLVCLAQIVTAHETQFALPGLNVR